MWISVNDRLPDKEDYYLVRCPNFCESEMSIALFVRVNKKSCWEDNAGGWISEYVTHWMQLPKLEL